MRWYGGPSERRGVGITRDGCHETGGLSRGMIRHRLYERWGVRGVSCGCREGRGVTGGLDLIRVRCHEGKGDEGIWVILLLIG